MLQTSMSHHICCCSPGIADGVGGWSQVNIDSGVYSRMLMATAKAAAAITPVSPIAPQIVLEEAHRRTNVKVFFLRDNGGSSALCIMCCVANDVRVRSHAVGVCNDAQVGTYCCLCVKAVDDTVAGGPMGLWQQGTRLHACIFPEGWVQLLFSGCTRCNIIIVSDRLRIYFQFRLTVAALFATKKIELSL